MSIFFRKLLRSVQLHDPFFESHIADLLIAVISRFPIEYYLTPSSDVKSSDMNDTNVRHCLLSDQIPSSLNYPIYRIL